MKRLLLLLLLLPSLAWGQISASGVSLSGISTGTAATAVTYCTSATACGTNHCNILCEDIESTTDCGSTSTVEKCRLTWTEAVAGAGTSIAFDNTPSSGLTCTSGNNQNVLVTVAGTTGHTAVIGKDLGSDYAATFGASWYWRTSAMAGTGQSTGIFTAENVSNQTTVAIYVAGSGSYHYLKVTYCKSGVCNNTAIGSHDVSVNTWHRISFLLIPGESDNGTLSVFLDDTETITLTDVDDVRPIRNVYFGQRAAGAVAHNDQFKNIRLDSTQRPEACE